MSLSKISKVSFHLVSLDSNFFFFFLYTLLVYDFLLIYLHLLLVLFLACFWLRWVFLAARRLS